MALEFLFEFVVKFADRGWSISYISAKFIIIFLVLFSYRIFSGNFLDILRNSFRDLILSTAPYFIFTISIAAIIDLLLNRPEFSSMLIIFPAAYLLYKADEIKEKKSEIKFTKIKEIFSIASYIFALVISIFATISGNILLAQLSALFYLGIIFWTL